MKLTFSNTQSSLTSKKAGGGVRVSMADTLMRQTQKGFGKGQTPNMLMAERLTFSNFNKDPNQFEAFQMEPQQTPFLRRQSPNPSQQPTSLQKSQTQPFLHLVIKKSAPKLAPLSIISKKMPPVLRKFPHDFFTNEGGNHHYQQQQQP